MIANIVQLWQSSIHISNLFYTLLLLLVVVYWLTVMLGVLDVDAFDLDICEAETGAEPTVAAHGHEGLLEYFNLRQVPLTIVVSIFALSLWLLGVLANHYLHGTASGMLGLAVFVPNVIVSAHVAKFITMPLVPLFRGMHANIETVRDMAGMRVTVTSSKADARFGQAEAATAGDGPPVVLSVRTEGEVLPKGAEAVVLYEDADKHVYVITKLEV